MTSLLLIDLDETLVDRDAVLQDWAWETARAEGRLELADWLIAYDRAEGRVRDRASFLAGVAATFGWQQPVEQLLAEWPAMFGARYQLDEMVAAALRRARQAGFRIAVVSNGDVGRQRAKIEAMRLSELVDGCVVSGEIGVRKPDPRIFEIAAERAGTNLDGQVWVIGDDPVADIGGGHGINARTIWVNRSHKHWPSGHLEPQAHFDDPVRAIEHVIDDASP
ncbi:HAD family hydrolase [Ornithinimicrobium faecis]|uniref:HAD family hydrolase n=1 Tax=Ornithinimicrobium faecis TaxID=2934158 RepID=UPI0021184BD9|nr:HAD family hydrolase [Ornithinimicrobium sp. HY1745]